MNHNLAIPNSDSAGQAYVLVVVDMQPLFRASLKPGLIEAVAHQVQIAVASGMPVIILECWPEVNGPTHSAIQAELAGYDSLKHIVLSKRASGGGREVSEACELLGYATTTFRFCGVNTTDCVFHTADETARRYPQAAFHLVEEACADEFHQEEAWAYFGAKARHRLQYHLL